MPDGAELANVLRQYVSTLFTPVERECLRIDGHQTRYEGDIPSSCARPAERVLGILWAKLDLALREILLLRVPRDTWAIRKC